MNFSADLFQRRTIRAKLIAYVVLLLVVTFGAVLLVVVELDRRSVSEIESVNGTLVASAINQQWERDIELLTVLLADEFVQPMHELNIFSMQRAAKLVSSRAGIMYVLVQDAQGRVIVDTTEDKKFIGKFLRASLTRQVMTKRETVARKEPSAVDIATPIMLGGKVLGIVRIGYSTAPIVETTNKTVEQLSVLLNQVSNATLKYFFVVLVAILLVALLVGLYLVRNLTVPIEQLSNAAKKIADGVLTQPVKITSKDEFGELGDTFNYMILELGRSRDRIESSQQALSTLNQELEDRVVERTRDLEEAQGELVKSERLATLGQLTAIVSHELRNPLGVMRSSVYVLQNKLVDTDPLVVRALERTDRNITRCDQIIGELLDFTRSGELAKETTEIDKWLSSVIDEQQVPDGVRVELALGLADLSLDIDPYGLHRVIVNVYDNACQAMAQESSQLSGEDAVVKIRTTRVDNLVQIEISDDGPGMDRETLSKAFEPLYSTKGFGVGLGLPIVKQIMHQHGGNVEIDTAVGRGTRVILTLPFAAPSQASR